MHAEVERWRSVSTTTLRVPSLVFLEKPTHCLRSGLDMGHSHGKSVLGIRHRNLGEGLTLNSDLAMGHS